MTFTDTFDMFACPVCTCLRLLLRLLTLPNPRLPCTFPCIFLQDDRRDGDSARQIGDLDVLRTRKEDLQGERTRVLETSEGRSERETKETKSSSEEKKLRVVVERRE